MKTIRLYDSCADYELAVDGSVEGSSLPKNSICYCKDAKKVCYNLKIVGTTDKTEPFNLYINGIDKDTYKSKAQQVSVKDGFFELGLTSKPYDAFRMFGGDSLDANHTPIGDAWNVKSVIRLDGVDNLKNLSYMFQGCVSLGYVNCGGWNTSKVTNMRNMFQGCSGLTTIDVSKWTTNNVTNMRGIFSQCSGLTTIDVSNWNTSKVTDMSYMFNSCNGLKSIDVSHWDTSKVTDMSYMINLCGRLMSIDVSGWDTSKVTNMEHMFLECRNVKKLDVSKWNVSKVTKFAEMFRECYSLTELDLSGWDLSSCKDSTINLFGDDRRSEHKRDGDLTTIKLGQGFFKGQSKNYSFDSFASINWSRESMMESLYTNQNGRDTADTKTVYLKSKTFARLSSDDISKINTVGINIVKRD